MINLSGITLLECPGPSQCRSAHGNVSYDVASLLGVAEGAPRARGSVLGVRHLVVKVMASLCHGSFCPTIQCLFHGQGQEVVEPLALKRSAFPMIRGRSLLGLRLLAHLALDPGPRPPLPWSGLLLVARTPHSRPLRPQGLPGSPEEPCARGPPRQPPSLSS